MTSTKALLLVDDDVDLLGIFRLALTGLAEIEVISVGSVDEALRVAMSRRIDLVLTDFRMEDSTGIDLLLSLQENGAWPRLGAVIMSGDDDPLLPQKAIDAGAKDFWRKPISAATLRSKVIELAKEEC